MTPEAAEALVAATSEWPQEGSATTVIESLSGAVSDLNPEDTAFPWRRQSACVQWYTETPTSVIVDSANAWLKSAHTAVQSHSEGGYVNYVEVDTPAVRYLGGNLTRLAAVRQKYDPGRLTYSGLSY